ncbi:MAG: FAD-dependent oxidoreductase [Rhodospirillales bacterium]|nr:FAD-dependent oxidoreductase [Rhodospirillales bacterium]
MTRPGEAKLPHLFQKGRLGPFEIKNRIKYGACCVSNFNTRDGYITAREIARMKVINRTGCGIITNQGAYTDPLGEGKAYFSQIALYDEKFLPQFAEIADDIHANGAIAIQQLLHAGRYGGIDLGYCVQPSVVPQTLPHFRAPREMTKEQIRATIAQHVHGAKLSLQAGFDGVEVTSFMGYLLANFNSRFTNQRTDEYGGSTRNRGRFMRELLSELKTVMGEKPVIVRLNAVELMDRWGGSTEEECFDLMAQAAECGVDMISVTIGWQEAPESSIGRDIPPGHWNYLAAKAKKLLPDMLITFGVRLPDPVMANACIAKGDFDYWEVCRPLLADPELVIKAAEDRLDEVKRCVGQLNCLSRLFRDLPYTCSMNPALGHEVEPEYNIKPPAVKKKVMIVGAGPAGMECAIAAAKRGHAVTVFEKSDHIGGAFKGYAMHDLANRDDLQSIIRYYETVARKLGITVKLSTEVTPKLMRSSLHQFDVAVVATGARIDMNAWPKPTQDGLLVDARDVAMLKVKPGKRVVVLGGGKIGLTLAESTRQDGSEVTIVEREKRIGGDVSPSWKWRHTSWVEELKIATITSAKVTKIGDGGVTVVSEKGGEQFLPADTVIAAGPRLSNQELFHELEWMVDEVHGCGDSLIPRSLTIAIQDGFKLGCQI